MASGTLHESPEPLSPATRDLHRGLLSLMEELEAIDAYGQRADLAADPQLKEVFLHNRREEIEHASMLLEWLRRHDAHFDEMLRTYLFTEAPIAGLEQAAATGGAATSAAATLGIGSMRGS